MSITLRAFASADIEPADHISRLAFGTFFALPDPMKFRGDGGLVEPRFNTYPDGGLVAEEDGTIVGLAFSSNWGSLGIFGPVAVHPDLWKRGVARQLVGASLEIMGRWRCRVMGLFTFPQSASHMRLYQEFGFWPRHLLTVVQKPVGTAPAVEGALSLRANPARRAALAAACQALAGSIYDGLDLRREIEGALRPGMGDVVLLQADGGMTGFAICHSGRGSESTSTNCNIKFALVRSGNAAPQRMTQLIAACEAHAREQGLSTISTAANTGRHGTYRLMVELGFRTQIQGVAMHRPWVEAYDRPDIFALEDWR